MEQRFGLIGVLKILPVANAPKFSVDSRLPAKKFASISAALVPQFVGFSCFSVAVSGREVSRVVGGVDAAEGAWPWQLSLRYLGSHSCGASLVNAHKAACAAHCVGNAVLVLLLRFCCYQNFKL